MSNHLAQVSEMVVEGKVKAMTTLHERLRSLRHSAGMTLEQAASAAGTSVSYLSDVERGRTRPSLAMLERIAAVYGLSVGEALVNVGITPDGDMAAN